MNKDELLRRYLEGGLSPEEEKQALHKIAEDEELRAMLRFEQQLNEASLEESFSYDSDVVPEDFSAQVMHRISAEEEAEKSSVLQQLRSWFQGLFIPQQIQWRPIYAFAVAGLVLFALAYPLYMTQQMEGNTPSIATNSNNGTIEGSVQQVSSGGEEVLLRFVYIDEQANSVAVAGDFNDWEPVKMTSQQLDGKQVWTALVSMPRGEHHYMFVKNEDQWITDPLATIQQDDGFGNKNAVIYL